jgi:putative ABC transport system ATP-binding protein
MNTSLVQARGLTKIYREGEQQRVVFRDLDAEIGRNEFIALLGRSGSGKSTLLNIISGIDLATAGEVHVDGTSLGSLSETARTVFRREHIGFVFQFFNLIPTLTVEENLLLPLELNGRLDAATRTFAQDLLEEVGLADRVAS